MHDMQEMQEPGGPVLLSAQQVQTMLRIDRSTVYRMAEDGRLPAIKIGKQWRFPADRIAGLVTHAGLLAQGGSAAQGGATQGGAAALPDPAVDVPAPEAPAIADSIAPETATAVTQVAADLLGVMMVVTDMDGNPITAVANPCRWFADRSQDPDLLSACTAEWQQMADDPDFEPKFSVGALGFECARAFVRSGSSLVGMVLVGGIAPPGSQVADLYHLDDDARRAVLSALPRVASALSRVAPREPRANAPRSR